MTENEIFYKIADNNFKVFSICSEDDVEYLKSIRDISELRENIKHMIQFPDQNLKSITRVELFCLLTRFLFDKCTDITNLEICTIYSIFYNILTLSFRKNSKFMIVNNFKRLVIEHSMNRPPFQIGILAKVTVEKITDFFINNIYKRFEFLKYMLTKKKNVEVCNKYLFEVKLPHVLDLQIGNETIARNIKILKQYLDNRKPKSEIEQKIELILDLERNKLDKKLEETFTNQDEIFNKKLEELLSKKKK